MSRAHTQLISQIQNRVHSVNDWICHPHRLYALCRWLVRFHSPELEAHLSVYLAVVGIENVESQGGLDDASAVFGNKIFRNIVLSLAATYGLYIIASILALEPWHMCKLRPQQ